MKKVMILIVALGLLATAALVVNYDFKEQIYKKSFNIKEDTKFSIQSGTSVSSILAFLYNEQLLEPYQGIVPLHWYIQLYGYLNQKTSKQIQAGEYLIKPNMKFHQFLDKAFVGQVIQRKFSIIEGYTLRQILDAMEKVPNIKLTTTDYRDISRQLDIPHTSPEGWIFPDTYYYTAGSDSINLLKQGYRTMRAVLEEAWQARDLRVPLASPYEALILASIVEKETAIAEERSQVAGVFIARLVKRMRLQADPTIIYGLGSRFDGNLRSKDLKEDQPYNTYTRGGLPPTPIAMPSLSSINAVMHPEFNDYLYFVAKGDGSHHFSKTYAEHSKAVRKYQLKR